MGEKCSSKKVPKLVETVPIWATKSKHFLKCTKKTIILHEQLEIAEKYEDDYSLNTHF